jgi:two-component system phosphate regulon sensor histidine kinase PhoR
MTIGLLISIAVSALALACIGRLLVCRARASCEAEIRALQLRHEADLKQARMEQERMLDALNDAFLLVDPTASIRFANKAAYALFDGRNLLHRSVAEAFLDSRLADVVLGCLATGKPARSRIAFSPNPPSAGETESRGIRVWVIDAAQVSDTPGEDTITRVIIRDVTAEHHLDQVRKDFVANASHELRTPLAIINGYLENLLDDGMINEPGLAHRFLAIMRKHTVRISRIVEDMLVISRLESGEAGALKLKPFRFRSCINDILERLEPVIHTQNATVEVVMRDPDLILNGDRFYWTQVLFNLVENALKQNPHFPVRIEIGCIECGDHCNIWVSDNGTGIPSADLPHIFRRFFRVEKHHSQHEIKGTGLGLSIVKRAVEAHHGTIGVTSLPGRETKFSISVPRNAAEGMREDSGA